MELGKIKNNLIAIGNDERVFTDPLLRKKALDYGGAFDSAHIICRSSLPEQKIEKDGVVTFYPVHSRLAFIFPFKVWLLGRKIISRHAGVWLTISDNPFEIGLVSWLLAKKSCGKFFLQIHTDFMSPYFRRSSWKERVRYYIARFVVPRADCIRAVSERIRESLLQTTSPKLKAKIKVVPIVTEVEKFFGAVTNPQTDARFKNYEFKMVAVGRFVDKEKNFGMLVEVMWDFIKICPRAILVLVGDGSDKNNYKEKIKNQGLEKHVILEGWRNDLPAFLKSFDLFLLSSNYEGWGRVAIEAMASGLPVIMTDVGLARDVVKNGENGLVIPVGDRKKMTEAVVNLYKNADERKRLASRGLETVKKIGVKTEDEYFKAYKNLLVNCRQ